MQIRRAETRGHADLGWLNTHHTFSFGHYYDPAHMGFKDLRVINEDRVQAGQGFGTHPHRDMEILTLVMEGALEHQDTMGNRSVIRKGEIQRMSAGTGVAHSEYNHSRTEGVHFYQIWIRPDRLGLEPGYQQARYPESEDEWILLAGRDSGLVRIHQDTRLYLGRSSQSEPWSIPFSLDRSGWLQILRGHAKLAGHSLKAGDGVAFPGASDESLVADPDAEFLFFDLNANHGGRS